MVPGNERNAIGDETQSEVMGSGRWGREHPTAGGVGEVGGPGAGQLIRTAPQKNEPVRHQPLQNREELRGDRRGGEGAVPEDAGQDGELGVV